MKYLNFVFENDNVTALINDENNTYLINEATTNCISNLILIDNYILENLKIFIDEDLILTYNNIQEYALQESLNLIDITNTIIADTELTFEDKQYLLVDVVDEYIIEGKHISATLKQKSIVRNNDKSLVRVKQINKLAPVPSKMNMADLASSARVPIASTNRPIPSKMKMDDLASSAKAKAPVPPINGPIPSKMKMDDLASSAKAISPPINRPIVNKLIAPPVKKPGLSKYLGNAYHNIKNSLKNAAVNTGHVIRNTVVNTAHIAKKTAIGTKNVADTLLTGVRDLDTAVFGKKRRR